MAQGLWTVSIPLTEHQVPAVFTCSELREGIREGKEGREKGKEMKKQSGAPRFQGRHADSPNKLIKGSQCRWVFFLFLFFFFISTPQNNK